ncbi:MAG: hypothetical protein M0P31_07750 [Solirubrobacteraceae bacterium]|nr:hypothetical protein [Solirubrobacteraceae bacterium]
MPFPTKPTMPKIRAPRWSDRAPRTRAVVLAAAVVAVGTAPIAVGATGDNVRQGVRNGTITQETEIISNAGAIPGKKGGYSTRQSNLSTTGGGAIYGCRSTARVNAKDLKNPCIRANNLSTGLAFELHASNGPIAGAITTGKGGDGTKPFITNATGVADGLNADRVDGKHAEDLVKDAVAAAAKANPGPRWAIVNAKGEIEAQSGGFKVVSAYPASPADAAPNVYLDAGADLSKTAISATLADKGTAAPASGGEITATRCAIENVVTCEPEGTNTANHIVVSPRQSDGSPTAADARKRFQITVTP